MEKEILTDILKQQGCPAFMIEKTIEKLAHLSPVLQEAFTLWVMHGIKPSITLEGYSYTSLIEQFHMKPVGAFLTLDWIVREPEEAVKSLKRGIK